VVLLLLCLLNISDLPPAARSVLDREYPGWAPAPIAAQVREWFGQQRFGHEPNLAHFDFDHDGTPDWALEILAGNREQTVVLLARGSSYDLQLLADDPPDPFTYLLVNRSGDREFNFETLQWFHHARNTLQLMYFDRPPLLFEWSGGKFKKKVMPNDEESDPK